MKALVVWGASAHARVVAEIVRLRGGHEIVAFIDDSPQPGGESFEGAPVIHGRAAVLELVRQRHDVEIIVGFGDCAGRLAVSRWCRQQGLSLGTAVHPSAIVSPSAGIGGGAVIMAGAVINPGAVIGESVIINTAATVDHDCIIGDGSHLSPGAHLGGGVRVGEATWIGVGASVRDHVSIGSRSVIGVGAAVVGDIPDGVVAFGNPARVIRAAGEGQR